METIDNRFIINRKIETIIIDKGLSSSRFADDINVPRSSISHILADRNKPSLEIIHKIIQKYPDISFDWLMDGDLNSSEKTMQATEKQSDSVYKRTPQSNLDFDRKTNPEYNTVRPNVGRYKTRQNERVEPILPPTNNTETIVSALKNKNKEVVRVLVFYADNTFDTFNSNL